MNKRSMFKQGLAILLAVVLGITTIQVEIVHAEEDSQAVMETETSTKDIESEENSDNEEESVSQTVLEDTEEHSGFTSETTVITIADETVQTNEIESVTNIETEIETETSDESRAIDESGAAENMASADETEAVMEETGEGTDYKAKYTYTDKKGKKAGTTVKIELTGKNACEGKVTLENVPIMEADLSTCITIPSDLILDAAKKEKSRAAEGSGYKGEKTVSYRIASKLTSLKKLKVKDAAIFDGRNPITLAPEKIVYGNDETPFKDGEIIISAYKNNTRAGTVQMTIQGMGRFYGTKTLKFKIA